VSKVCCSNQSFERHPDDRIADIGGGGGVEYTIGNCKSCGAVLIHCWVWAGRSGLEVVSQEFVSRLLSVSDYKTRKALLSDWFNSL
jgi:hypothetical protein